MLIEKKNKRNRNSAPVMIHSPRSITKCIDSSELAPPTKQTNIVKAKWQIRKLDRTWHKTTTKHNRNFISKRARPNNKENYKV
jgi:hypothetical protein